MTLLPAIRDTTTFAKLYPVRFPIAQNAGYYLYRLGRAITKPLPLAYPWLPQALRDFAELERTHAGGGSLSSELQRQRSRMVAELAARVTMPSIDPAPGFAQKDTIASAAGRLLGYERLADLQHLADKPQVRRAIRKEMTLPMYSDSYRVVDGSDDDDE